MNKVADRQHLILISAKNNINNLIVMNSLKRLFDKFVVLRCVLIILLKSDLEVILPY